MLQEKAGHQRRQGKETTIYADAKRRSEQGEGRGIRFEDALDIPLAIEFGQTPFDRCRAVLRNAGDAFLGGELDSIVDVWRRVLRDAACGGWKHSHDDYPVE